MRVKATLGFFLASTALLAQSYGLEELTNERAKNIAPQEIQKFMKSKLKADFKECLEYSKPGQHEADNYFRSIQIPLGLNSCKSFLVFPSKYCSPFFGAHAISYWLISKPKTGDFRILYSGASDGFEILGTKSKGLYDIESWYGRTYTVLKFNGKTYRKFSEGEQPND